MLEAKTGRRKMYTIHYEDNLLSTMLFNLVQNIVSPVLNKRTLTSAVGDIKMLPFNLESILRNITQLY